MEFFQELFLSVALSLLFAFLIAKLVSMASDGDVDQESVLTTGEELREISHQLEGELRNQRLESERRVEFVGEAVKVDEFEGELGQEGSEMLDGGKDIVKEGCESVEIGVEEEVKEEEEEEERSSMEEKISAEDGELEENLVEEKPEKVELHEIGLELMKEEQVIAKDEQENEIGIVKSGADDEKEGLFSDEDDWEGIERSEVEKLFGTATTFVGSGVNKDLLLKLGSDLQMQLYGLHKVATEGPCYEPQPLALMVSARAKWNAWQQLGNMSPDVAMEQYINLLSAGVPGWMGESPEGGFKQDKNNDSPEAVSGTKAQDLISFLHHQPGSGDERKSGEVQSFVEGGHAIGDAKACEPGE